MIDKNKFLYQLFLNFLDLHKCNEKYFINRYNSLGTNDIIDIKKPGLYFKNAFCWSDTDEGYDYWAYINHEWVKVIKVNYKFLHYVYYHKEEIKKLLIRFVRESYLDGINLRKISPIDFNLIITCNTFNAILTIGDICVKNVKLLKLHDLNRIWTLTLIEYYDKFIKFTFENL